MHKRHENKCIVISSPPPHLLYTIDKRYSKSVYRIAIRTCVLEIGNMLAPFGKWQKTWRQQNVSRPTRAMHWGPQSWRKVALHKEITVDDLSWLCCAGLKVEGNKNGLHHFCLGFISCTKHKMSDCPSFSRSNPLHSFCYNRVLSTHNAVQSSMFYYPAKMKQIYHSKL